MAWYDPTKKVPVSRVAFNRIIDGFVFCCPSSIKSDETDNANPKKRNIIYKEVSKRACSFRKRGIESTLLTTLLALIRKPLTDQKTYSVLKDDEDVATAVDRIIIASSLADPFFDIMVYKHHPKMSDAEAIYYYIRNAFAHGSFEVKCTKRGCYYLLQSDKDGKVKAQMRLRESTLNHLLELSKMSASDLRAKQRNKRR